MKVNEWLQKVAYQSESNNVDEPDVYLSIFDDSYITHIGSEDNVKHLAELEITEHLTHGVGKSLKDGKWYGWSHRAIFGFKVGSTCKNGDCHFKPSNLQETIQAAVDFWDCEDYLDLIPEVVSDTEISITWTYANTTPNKKLHGTKGGHTVTYDANDYGKGEWVAENESDAMQMAKDFNDGVS